MGLWSVSLRVPSESEEAVTELLGRSLDATPVAYADFDTGYSTVTSYLLHSPLKLGRWRAEIVAGLQAIRRAGLDIGWPSLRLRRVRTEDWANSWKRHFRPLAVGSALLVRPSWSRKRPRRGQGLLILDPGLSFGTGQHPTTAFCLRQVVAAQSAGASTLLDIGSGSGILALAAARLGFSRVDAFDFDPVAVGIARANARRNRLSGRVHFLHRDLTRLPRRSTRTYDIICANLLANLLIEQRDRILARLSQRGQIVLAGILAREFATVARSYRAAGLRLVTSRQQAEWRSATFSR